MTKRERREHLFLMLFRKEFYQEGELPEQVQLYLKDTQGVSAPKKEALEKRMEEIFEKIPEIDKIIEEKAEGWKLKRFAKADLTIIRLALYEILFDEDIPTGISINEAVELGRKFGGDKSPAFINGVLAKCTR